MNFIRLLVVAALVGLSSFVAVPALADEVVPQTATPPWLGFRPDDVPTSWGGIGVIERAILAGQFFDQPPRSELIAPPSSDTGLGSFRIVSATQWASAYGVTETDPSEFLMEFSRGTGNVEQIAARTTYGANLKMICQRDGSGDTGHMRWVSPSDVTSRAATTLGSKVGTVAVSWGSAGSCAYARDHVLFHGGGPEIDAYGRHRPQFMFVRPGWDQTYVERAKLCAPTFSAPNTAVMDECGSNYPVLVGSALRGQSGEPGTWKRLISWRFTESDPYQGLLDVCEGAQCGVGYSLADGTVCGPGWSDDPAVAVPCAVALAEQWASASCEVIGRPQGGAGWSIIGTPEMPVPIDPPDPERSDCAKVRDVHDPDYNPPDEPGDGDDGSTPVDLGPIEELLKQIRDGVRGLGDLIGSAADRIVEAVRGGSGSDPDPGDGDGPGDGQLPGDSGFDGVLDGFWGGNAGAWRDAIGGGADAFAIGSCTCAGWSLTLPVVGSVEVGSTCGTGVLSQWAAMGRNLTGILMWIGAALIWVKMLSTSLGFVGLGMEADKAIKAAEKSDGAKSEGGK